MEFLFLKISQNGTSRGNKYYFRIYQCMTDEIFQGNDSQILAWFEEFFSFWSIARNKSRDPSKGYKWNLSRRGISEYRYRIRNFVFLSATLISLRWKAKQVKIYRLISFKKIFKRSRLIGENIWKSVSWFPDGKYMSGSFKLLPIYCIALFKNVQDCCLNIYMNNYGF